MKNFKIIFLFVAFLTTGLALTSCGGNATEQSSSETEATEQQGKEYTAAYICPMHCKGSGSDKAGTCPVCGMDYVKNEKYKTEAKSQESHEGHDHDSHEGHNH